MADQACGEQPEKEGILTTIQKPGKDPALPSSYRPISQLDTIGNLFEKIPLSRNLCEMSGSGLLRNEQFGFRPKHSTSLQLARLVERVSRNFDEKKLTGEVFLDVVKAFDNVWVDGLLYKITILSFPSYLVKTISYLKGRTFEASFQTVTYTSRRMRAGVDQGGIISPVLFSLYVNDLTSPSRHVELALYAEDTAVIAMPRQPALLVRYLETYLSGLGGGSQSMSPRALQCSSPIPVGESRNPERFSSSGSQSNGSTIPVILG